jgi:hypothetical protein
VKRIKTTFRPHVYHVQFVLLLPSLSDRRAEDRAAYELERTAKEAGLEGARREQEERRRREDEEEVTRLRKAAVHKAQPVKHYRPMEVSRRMRKRRFDRIIPR